MLQSWSVLTMFSVPAQYWLRYSDKGKQLEFGADNVITDKSTWLSTSISWTPTKNNTVTVVSPFYKDDTVRMCKVITLSRYLEWILIDAFKKQ